jgi:hypothetical protein
VVEALKAGASPKKVLLPMPKARFCTMSAGQAIPVDFVFWTGERFVAIFLHESSFDQDQRKDEMISLRIWGVEVFSLMADEFETYGLMSETGMKIREAIRLP